MTDTPETPPAGNPHGRRRAFLILAVVIVMVIAAYTVWALFLKPASEETDDAYVAGDIVSITAREAGTVIAIRADSTQSVTRGQPLIDLDPSSADAGMAAAEAELARAVRAVRTDTAKVDEGHAEVAQAETTLASARADLGRRRGAASQGAVSGEEVAHAADAVRSAAATLALARSRLTQARASVQGTDIDTNPQVLAAVAAFRRAAIAQGHMHLKAPVDGIIAQRTVQLGQQVAAGTPLMAVVPLHRIWVDANFRETQLADIRIDQPATLKSDIYGGDVVFHGKVIGLGAGSGNAFALLPPQNASGNWIKIVQRVPVRIAIDPADLDRHPLRVGLSIKANVDTSDTRGSPVATRASGNFQMQASDAIGPDIDGRIARIIAANRAGGESR